MTYLERLRALTAQRGALCVGIDPHPELLSAWQLPVDPAGLARFAYGVVEALGERVACFKPQSAFFESYGAAGIAVLEQTIARAHDAGALVILDVKRGDIGSTMTAYASAYLGFGPLAADAITVTPYLGFGSLAPAFEMAEANDRGVYVLARTSNPEGAAIQLAATQPRQVPVVQTIIDAAQARNLASGKDAIGLVVGAAHAETGADLSSYHGSILAPGIGAQGGSMSALGQIFGQIPALILPSASREILQGGPTAAGLNDRVTQLLAG